MKRLFTAALAFAATVTGTSSPLDRVVIAAMKLSEENNYSWITTVADDAGTYDVEGKTATGSYTWQRQPIPDSIAPRLGRDAERELDAFFLGKQRFVIRTGAGWQTLAELPRRNGDWVEQNETQYVAIPAPPDLNLDGMISTDPWAAPSVIYVPVPREENPRPHSNYQFALSLPHEELAIIVSSYVDLSVDGDTASGSLSDLGARLLLVHDGHEYIKPLVAAGTFKLWLKDGRVAKYRLELAGVVKVKRKQILVQQRMSTILENVGSTAFEIPAEVRRKLGE